MSDDKAPGRPAPDAATDTGQDASLSDSMSHARSHFRMQQGVPTVANDLPPEQQQPDAIAVGGEAHHSVAPPPVPTQAPPLAPPPAPAPCAASIAPDDPAAAPAAAENPAPAPAAPAAGPASPTPQAQDSSAPQPPPATAQPDVDAPRQRPPELTRNQAEPRTARLIRMHIVHPEIGTIDTTIRNVSAHGMGGITSAAIRPGDIVELHLTDGRHIKAEIRWTRPQKDRIAFGLRCREPLNLEQFSNNCDDKTWERTVIKPLDEGHVFTRYRAVRQPAKRPGFGRFV
ncbi:MAG: PilZ domain-containing protein [Pseudomonadota bacterium]